MALVFWCPLVVLHLKSTLKKEKSSGLHRYRALKLALELA